MTRIAVDAKQPEHFQDCIKNAFPGTVILNLGESSGDVMINTDKGHLIAIEIKEVPDFFASIRDRRLFKQSKGIRSITPFAFLLIAGDIEYDHEWYALGRSREGWGRVGFTRAQIDGALTRVQAEGVIVRYAYNGYVEAIKSIIGWVEHSENGFITRPEPPKLSPFDDVDQQAVNWLSCFDGIGVIQARNFVQFYGKRPIYEYLRLATTPFTGAGKPHGWTNKTIEKCRRQLGLDEETYLSSIKRPKEWAEELD